MAATLKSSGTTAQEAISARRIFDPVAGSYELWAQTLGLFQYRKWRRHLVSRLGTAQEGLLLDVCTGPAGVAMEMAAAGGRRVVGVDLSRKMLGAGVAVVQQRGLEDKVRLAQARAEALPFPDASFDAVVFTFLLRYVQDPEDVLQELVRVLRPGGRLLSLEFSVPDNRAVRALWLLYTRIVLPVAALPISSGWRRVGRFLGPSISAFYQRYPLKELTETWKRVGMREVGLQRMSLGGAVIMWGTKGA